MKELNFNTLLETIKNKKNLFFSSVTIFVILGTILALGTPKVYSSKIELMSIQSSPSKTGLGNLGGIAGLAGISFGASESGELSPAIYSKIMRSSRFLLELKSKRFYYPLIGDSIDLATYDINYGKTSLMSRVLGVPTNLAHLVTQFFSDDQVPGEKEQELQFSQESEILQISAKDRSFLEGLANSIEINFNENNGVTTIVSFHQNPVLSAQITQFGYKYLEEFLEVYKSSQQRKKLDFINKQLQNKKNEFMVKQKDLAEFRDRNIGSLSNAAKTELDNLQSEFNLSFNVVNSLNQEKEEAALRLEENSGVFKVLEPVIIANSPSKPNRKLIVLGFLFLGMFLSIALIFILEFLRIKKRGNLKQ